MDPTTTVIVIAGLPPGAEVALDLAAWAAGPAFMGVSGVPPGCHVLASAPAPGALRTARLLHVRAGQVVVAVWDAREERLRVAAEVDEDAAARLAAGLARHELDARLAPYAADVNAGWAAATRCVLPDVVARVEPVESAGGSGGGGGARVRARLRAGSAEVADVPPVAAAGAAAAPASVPRATLDSWHQHAMGLASDDDSAAATGGAAPPPVQPLAQDPRVRALRTQAAASDGDAASAQGRLFYTALPGVGSGSAPAARTAHAVDTTGSLLGACRHLRRQLAAAAAAPPAAGALRHGGDELGDVGAPPVALVAQHLTGELQAAFALFMGGHSQPSLRQWTLLADAVLRAEDGALQLCAPPALGDSAAVASSEAKHQQQQLLGCLLPAALESLAAQLRITPPELLLQADTDVEPGAPGGAHRLAGGEDAFLRRAVGELARTCRAMRALLGGAAAAAPAALVAASPCGRYLRAAEAVFAVCRARLRWDVGDGGGSDEVCSAGGGAGPAASAHGAQGGGPRAYATREALLAALAAEGGDDELPVIVDDVGDTSQTV